MRLMQFRQAKTTGTYHITTDGDYRPLCGSAVKLDKYTHRYYLTDSRHKACINCLWAAHIRPEHYPAEHVCSDCGASVNSFGHRHYDIPDAPF